MTGRRTFLAILSLGLFAIALAGGGPAGAVPPDPVNDGNGKEWRQLYETTGISWSQLAGVCPRDGVTPCSGSIGTRVVTGWVWATAAQVVELMGRFEPAILAANPPSVSGGEYFGSAQGFLGEMRWTGYITTYGGYSEWTDGWTSSTDDAGSPLAGVVGFGWWPPAGSFQVSAPDQQADPSRGAFLWRRVVPTCHGLSPTRVGTALDDTITGTRGRDVIVSLGGSDTVRGNGGDDVVCGGDGADALEGGGGNDWLEGGAGSDNLSGGVGDDTLDGGADDDSLRGGRGIDTCTSGELGASGCER
jgi:hypothetical protein